ncbi:MAG: PQQ-dependent sugar dehydrogenase [Akkermansiaceae bacterium]|jgi:glucose/arabinose dehydrogenase
MKSLAILSLLALPIFADEAKLTLLASGFERPLDLTAAPGLDEELFVVEQGGKIFRIDRSSGKRLGEVLDLSGVVSRGHNEEGLLGLAFSPKFESDHRLYLYYTFGNEGNRKAQISRFHFDPESKTADVKKEEKLLSFTEDFGNHNGGWIAFGPDGMLYTAPGDGGKGNDPNARAQDLGNLLGSVLRIDVSGAKGYEVPADNPFVKQDGVKPEIYAYGLRNAWRCSFDAETGDFWIADVGQNHWEEVNFVEAGTLGGKNFGWRLREANHETPMKGVGGDSPEGAHTPIYEYDHDMAKPTGGLSITGGYVYHGSQESLKGLYLFADYVSRKVWGITQEGGKLGKFSDLSKVLVPSDGKPLGPVASFGQDNQKEVYIVDHTGRILRID